MKKRLTIADFFCGAGGFSEGFRQAGFEIKFAVDHWDTAVKTHRLNHPHCFYPKDGDILSIPANRINEIVPDVDVIIGSPPCVSFSTSNKAGNADKKLGIKLISKFLQIIAVKKHKKKSSLKYWMMENVPKSKEYLKKEYTFSMLGLSNEILNDLGIEKKPEDIAIRLDISSDNIFNALHFGVPQKRERLIVGNFPYPEKFSNNCQDWMTLGQVLSPLNRNNSRVEDPIYHFTVDRDSITDHFYDTSLSEWEWEEAMIKKLHGRFFGKMPFPENLERPARTIMATRTVMSREAMILPSKKGYRSPTIREIASLMSFPITYQFDGNDEGSKYRLVGNAVCPKLSFALAEAIRKKEGLKKRIYMHAPTDSKSLTRNLRLNPPKRNKEFKRKPNSNFVEIVPNMKIRNFRIELDNNNPKVTTKLNWRASIHHATGRDNMKVAFPSKNEILGILYRFGNKEKLKEFMKDVSRTFDSRVASSNYMQEIHCLVRNVSDYFTPRQILREINKLIDIHFPDLDYKNINLPNISKNQKLYLKFDKKLPKNEIPLRIVMALYALNYTTNLTKKRFMLEKPVRSY